MNFIILIIIVFSLIISTLISLHVLSIKDDKKLALLITFLINATILGISTIVLYKLDIQQFKEETDGLFDSLGILIFIFLIPVITLTSIYIQKFISSTKE